MRCPSRFVLPVVVACSVLVCAALRTKAEAAGEMHVAVLEFTNASKDPELASLGKGLQSMVDKNNPSIVVK